MKKTMLFAAMAAFLTVASCQKEEGLSQDSSKDPIFTATIENGVTKTSVDAANNKVAWVMNDEITVTDNASVSVKYIVSAIDGSGKATFTKKSGESGTLGSGPYTAIYGSAPSKSQTYSASAPSLPMSGASGASDTNLKFTVSCGLLEITLTQADESIKSISVSDNASTPNTYTLNCGDGVSIEDGAKFYIAVPAGTYTTFQFTNGTDVVRGRFGLSIEVVENHIKPGSSNFAPKYSTGKTDLDYGIKIGSTWWAPVNCGYDADHLCGKLYQWGRMDGSGYYMDATATVPAQDASDKVIQTNIVDLHKGTYTTSNPASDSFYKQPKTLTYDWYTSSQSAQFSSWPMTAPSNTSRIGNPCPSGWRVPTSDELGNLVYSDWDSSTQSGSTKRTYTFSSGYGTINGLTLPAAGSRSPVNGNFYNRGSDGVYWSSTVSGIDARSLDFNSSSANMSNYRRAGGYSVRCVQE